MAMKNDLVVLSFAAHPDDMEFTSAGTMALLGRKGCKLHIANMCDGDCGTFDYTKEQIRKIRFKEGVNASRVIGATYTWAGGHDLEIEYSHELRTKATQVVRKIRPDIILTLPPVDYMTDHEEASRLVRFASFSAGCPNFKTRTKFSVKRVPYLYYWDQIESRDLFGNRTRFQFYIDISDVIDVKTKMLKEHKSQYEWLKGHHHGMDHYIDTMLSMSRGRGREVGVKYAEVFSQHLGHSYPRDNILKEILKDAYIPAPK